MKFNWRRRVNNYEETRSLSWVEETIDVDINKVNPASESQYGTKVLQSQEVNQNFGNTVSPIVHMIRWKIRLFHWVIIYRRVKTRVWFYRVVSLEHIWVLGQVWNLIQMLLIDY